MCDFGSECRPWVNYFNDLGHFNYLFAHLLNLYLINNYLILLPSSNARHNAYFDTRVENVLDAPVAEECYQEEAEPAVAVGSELNVAPEGTPTINEGKPRFCIKLLAFEKAFKLCYVALSLGVD